jgi:ATP-dependent helicase/nuclease subunit A
MLLDRRLVAPQMLARYLERGPRDLTAAATCARAAARLRDLFAAVDGGLDAFLDAGPRHRRHFAMLASDVRALCADTEGFDARERQAAFRVLVDRLRGYFLTQDGRPRGRNFTGTMFNAGDCDSEAAWRRHRQAAADLAPRIGEAVHAFRRDLNVVLSRGIWRVFAVALRQYQKTLDDRALLDFSGVLERAVALLENMDEFAQSRFRLEARYRHVLVDEFQDTSRVQWRLVAQLVRSWGEGLGASADALPPSVFIVGDRKQSIYGFRDADVAVLDEAAAFVDGLRADGTTRRAIAVSFRAAPALLAFTNELFETIDKAAERPDRFRYDDTDRFPVTASDGEASLFDQPALGIVVGDTVPAAANAVAAEIARLLSEGIVRDRATGVSRAAQSADIAVLFRSRDSHREFEKALAQRGIATYVYKGLGFFDADEVQDVVALVRFLADPLSELRAAAFLRSRLAHVSDIALARLAPDLSAAILDPDVPGVELNDEDRRALDALRVSVPRWLTWVDRLPPAELVSRVLGETGYLAKRREGANPQERENLKKLAAMIRRFQNRGYATLARVADHLEELAVGDESNAALDARDSVSLMTVHASKGLEFPVVFIVNIGRGTGGFRPPVRVAADANGDPSVSVADFQSEADDDAQAREREETKRLLYVAATRARDRLYLSATVENGTFRPGRGSLGEVLPAEVKAFIAAAASRDSGSKISWRGHEFVVGQRS